MKKNMRKKSTKEIQLLKPEEMLMYRGGGEKPKNPKSPDEAVIFL